MQEFVKVCSFEAPAILAPREWLMGRKSILAVLKMAFREAVPSHVIYGVVRNKIPSLAARFNGLKIGRLKPSARTFETPFSISPLANHAVNGSG